MPVFRRHFPGQASFSPPGHRICKRKVKVGKKKRIATAAVRPRNDRFFGMGYGGYSRPIGARKGNIRS